MRKTFTAAFCSLLLSACIGSAAPLPEAAKHCPDLPRFKRYPCYTEAAKVTKDPTVCNRIIDTGFRVQCVKGVALQECDTEYCSAITEEWKIQNCIDAIEDAKSIGQC